MRSVIHSSWQVPRIDAIGLDDAVDAAQVSEAAASLDLLASGVDEMSNSAASIRRSDGTALRAGPIDDSPPALHQAVRANDLNGKINECESSSYTSSSHSTV